MLEQWFILPLFRSHDRHRGGTGTRCTTEDPATLDRIVDRAEQDTIRLV